MVGSCIVCVCNVLCMVVGDVEMWLLWCWLLVLSRLIVNVVFMLIISIGCCVFVVVSRVRKWLMLNFFGLV